MDNCLEQIRQMIHYSLTLSLCSGNIFTMFPHRIWLFLFWQLLFYVQYQVVFRIFILEVNFNMGESEINLYVCVLTVMSEINNN